MNTILWITQVLLAVAFLLAGIMKITQTKEKLAENMGWVERFSSGQIRVIGILEFLGAIGLIVPAVTGILPWLTPLAAVGLALTMVGALITHLVRKETSHMVTNVVLMGLAIFIVYGRFIALPF